MAMWPHNKPLEACLQRTTRSLVGKLFAARTSKAGDKNSVFKTCDIVFSSHGAQAFKHDHKH